jgi:hypothetical protein
MKKISIFVALNPKLITFKIYNHGTNSICSNPGGVFTSSS